MLKLIGTAPSSFVECIRLLVADHKAGKSELSNHSAYQVSRLIKSQTVLACLYHFCRLFYPDRFTPNETRTPIKLAALLDPLTLATVIALTFLFKRCKRICNAEEWKFLEESFVRNTELAGKLGMQIPKIGVGYALLAEGLLHTAFAAFLAGRKAPFPQYRRFLKREKIRFDYAFETREWGCTSPELASRLAVAIGFGKQTGISLEEGLSGGPSPKFNFMNPISLYDACAFALLDFNNRKEALQKQAGEAIKTTVESWSDEAFRILNDPPAPNWMDRGKADGEPDKMPGLVMVEEAPVPPPEPSIAEAPPPAAESRPRETFIAADGREIEILSHYSDLPENLRSEISEAEFKQLQHMPIEEIIAMLAG